MRSLLVLASVIASTFLVTPVNAAPALSTATISATAKSPNVPLSIRAAATANSAKLGAFNNGARFTVECQVKGQWVTGSVRNTDRWNRLSAGKYVSDAYVVRDPNPPMCATTPPTETSSPNKFIDSAIAPARRSRTTHGVPVSVTIAQAILESSWGGSQLARKEHNLFGIKCFGRPGPIAVRCAKYKTSECKDNKCVPTFAQFRSYATEADSYLDHGGFLRANSRYKSAFAFTNKPDEFIRAIARAGYATDPHYPDEVIALMKQYNLYKYDV
jgi:flagellar protein FlgJ